MSTANAIKEETLWLTGEKSKKHIPRPETNKIIVLVKTYHERTMKMEVVSYVII